MQGHSRVSQSSLPNSPHPPTELESRHTAACTATFLGPLSQHCTHQTARTAAEGAKETMVKRPCKRRHLGQGQHSFTRLCLSSPLSPSLSFSHSHSFAAPRAPRQSACAAAEEKAAPRRLSRRKRRRSWRRRCQSRGWCCWARARRRVCRTSAASSVRRVRTRCIVKRVCVSVCVCVCLCASVQRRAVEKKEGADEQATFSPL